MKESGWMIACTTRSHGRWQMKIQEWMDDCMHSKGTIELANGGVYKVRRVQ
jgi:hypothetical protein